MDLTTAPLLMLASIRSAALPPTTYQPGFESLTGWVACATPSVPRLTTSASSSAAAAFHRRLPYPLRGRPL
jgi:hypothetical protein